MYKKVTALIMFHVCFLNSRQQVYTQVKFCKHYVFTCSVQLVAGKAQVHLFVPSAQQNKLNRRAYYEFCVLLDVCDKVILSLGYSYTFFQYRL